MPGTSTLRATRRAVGFCAALLVATLLDGCSAVLKDTPPTENSRGVLFLSQAAVSLISPENGVAPTPQQISITDSGGASVPSIQLGAITYSVGGSNWVTASLNNTHTPATLTLQESVLGLPPGIYIATVPIYSSTSLNSPQVVVIVVEITGRPVISASPDSVFMSAVAGGGNPIPQSVSVTNIGAKTLTGLSVSGISYSAGPTGWLTASLSQSNAPATLDLQGTTGSLAVGIYRATITLTSSDTSVSSISVAVEFDVASVASPPRIGASPTSLVFSAPLNAPNPTPQNINIQNTGGGTLTGLAVSNITYGIGGTGWLTANLSSTTGPSTLTISPSVVGLPPGAFTAAVEITSGVASNSPIIISVRLNVDQPPSIGLTPSNLTFTGVAGGANPGLQSVSVSNSGGGTLNQLQLGSTVYGGGQPTGWLQTQLVSPSSPTLVNLRPQIGGLTSGTYTATIPVISAIPGVATTNISVTLNLGGGSGSLVKLSGDGQASLPDSVLPNALVARVYDANGNPASGVTTSWAAAQGALSNVQSVTNSLGEARATWRLGPQGGLQSVQVTSAGLTPVTFNASAGTAPGANPGEPAGYNLISDRQFDQKVEDGWSDRGDTRFTIGQDPTAPKSPQNVGIASFPTGYVGGTGPINTWRVIGQYNDPEIYISFWVKLSSNWVGAPSAGINKVFHIWINGGSVVVFSAQGSNAASITPQMRLQNVEQDPRGTSFNLNPNIVPGARLIRGQWHRVEVLLAANTPGQPNGKVSWWLDGVQIAEYTDVGFISLSNPIPGAVNWQQVSWNPTYGAPSDVIQATQTMQMDHIYISGHH